MCLGTAGKTDSHGGSLLSFALLELKLSLSENRERQLVAELLTVNPQVSRDLFLLLKDISVVNGEHVSPLGLQSGP